ncbi:hypothetical protein [Parvibaculum sedimenti]|uniref:hypothetical protein n=1 Tax=Parvibaculum sedimenti TaxID=2608632 RepID=UPI00163A7B2D|nr:hypothetical protein [Parvibaculum sedimenti]
MRSNFDAQGIESSADNAGVTGMAAYAHGIGAAGKQRDRGSAGASGGDKTVIAK